MESIYSFDLMLNRQISGASETIIPINMILAASFKIPKIRQTLLQIKYTFLLPLHLVLSC